MLHCMLPQCEQVIENKFENEIWRSNKVPMKICVANHPEQLRVFPYEALDPRGKRQSYREKVTSIAS